MPRQIRDTVMTLAALCVLFTMLMTVSPRLRERASNFTSASSGQQWDASRSVVGHSMDVAFGFVSGYAGDNPYLFVFLIVACVLFVMMVRT